MVQPTTFTPSPEQQTNDSRQTVFESSTLPPRMLQSVVIPEPSPTELPYRTRVDYRADDDKVTSTVTPQAPAAVDHAMPPTQPRSPQALSGARPAAGQHVTSGHVINVTSSSPRDAATRIQIGDHPADREKRRWTLPSGLCHL